MPKEKSARSRAEERRAFLACAGWEGAQATPLTADASTRSYERLFLSGRTALLMNAPPRAEGAACPPGASPEERRRLGYNAMARLAGPNLDAFIAVAATARGAGLSAPEIYFADSATGLALIEDLGDALYARAIPAGAPEEELYAAAIDALLAFRAAGPKAPARGAYRMLSYDRMAMEAEVALVPEWYYPFVRDHAACDDLYRDYRASWSLVLDRMPAPSQIALRDYHAENLLWLPERKEFKRAGIIDFQDALIGDPAYDLVSLLEDARRDVSPNLAAAMIRRYCDGSRAAGAFDEAAFRSSYAVLGAQRNAKILGIFARLIRRDGKPKYASFLPRVEAHFRNNLRHPDLAPVEAFFRERMGDRF